MIFQLLKGAIDADKNYVSGSLAGKSRVSSCVQLLYRDGCQHHGISRLSVHDDGRNYALQILTLISEPGGQCECIIVRSERETELHEIRNMPPRIIKRYQLCENRSGESCSVPDVPIAVEIIQAKASNSPLPQGHVHSGKILTAVEVFGVEAAPPPTSSNLTATAECYLSTVTCTSCNGRYKSSQFKLVDGVSCLPHTHSEGDTARA